MDSIDSSQEQVEKSMLVAEADANAVGRLVQLMARIIVEAWLKRSSGADDHEVPSEMESSNEF